MTTFAQKASRYDLSQFDADDGLDPMDILTKTLKDATAYLSPQRARYVVDYYYQVQRDRIRAMRQAEEAMDAEEQSAAIMVWLAKNTRKFEGNIRNTLNAYSDKSELGRWAKSNPGIGPVIAAGLLAHIDIKMTNSISSIWRYAGLDPTDQWIGREDARKLVNTVMGDETTVTDEHVAEVCDLRGDNPEKFREWAISSSGSVTKESLIRAASRLPWNKRLKTLCAFKMGESFVKVCNKPDALYGHLYAERKAQEAARNEQGRYAEQAAAHLERYNVGKGTDAYGYYSEGFLPPAHIHARARRYAVKMFLSHYYQVAYELEYGNKPPHPWILQQPEHTHVIPVPNWD